MRVVSVGGEELELLPERAVLWRGAPGGAAVIVADLHLGKAAAFRSMGIPVPESTTLDTLGRLEAVRERVGAARVIVLGDLLHAPDGMTSAVFEAVLAWRKATGFVRMTLIPGNHDRKCGSAPLEWGLECAGESHVEGGLVMRHEPPVGRAEGYVLCGHLHPRVTMSDGTVAVRSACYWVRPGYMVLPAFGAFTGGSSVRGAEGDRVFLVGDGEVVEAAGVVSRRRGAARQGK